MQGQLIIPGGEEAKSRAPDARALLAVLLNNARLIGAITLGVMAIMMVVLFTLTPTYTSSVNILLGPNKGNVLGSETMFSELSMDSPMIDSQVTILKSEALRRRVVQAQKLDQDPEFATIGGRGLFSLWGALSGSAAPQPADAGGFGTSVGVTQRPMTAAEMTAVRELGDALDVRRVGVSYVIVVSVSSSDPQKAARLANAFADAYLLDQYEARYEVARRASQWLSERLASLRDELRVSEQAVEQFRAANNLFDTNTGSVTEQQLSELNANLVSARTDVAEKQAKFDQAQRIIDAGGRVDAVPDVLRSPVVSDLRSQAAEVSRREADLIARYGDRHPSVVKVRAELGDIRREIDREASRVVQNLQNELSVSKAREQALDSNVKALTGQSGADNQLSVQLRELQRIATANKALYESFLSRFKLSEEQTKLDSSEARIVSPALIPDKPSFPNKPLFLGLSLFFGLGAGVASAFAVEVLRSGFRNLSEVEEFTQLPALASVPLLKKQELLIDGAVMTPGRYLVAKPLSQFSEALRSVRVGVQMSDVDDPARVVGVTSSVPGEGKSTIATALAMSASQAFERVLLIDCDLRRPALTETFGLKGRKGLVDHLADDLPLNEILFKDAGSPVYVIGSGSHSQTPSDLLGSDRMRALIEQLRPLFDYIVLDAAPVGPVVDAVVVAREVDKVVFVTAWNTTPRELVRRCLSRIEGERRVAGIVLNKVDHDKNVDYGEYGYRKQYGAYYHS
ncbi:GumC family protein [Terrihabitans sp. B22-R8]|uniref:GumC family protein n=1 Tax=Terrihabitans sp. B22-R8 TaxID=3425128 RepID=UPI00403CC105